MHTSKHFIVQFLLVLIFSFFCVHLSSVEQSLEERLKAHIHYKEDGENTIGHLLIDDRTSGISESTWLYVKTGLDHYKKTRPAFIILELNTPGGEVYAAQKISDALKNIDIQDDIPVVAFINNWAISAGAMLAYSSRYIAVVKDGSMGAAEPIVMGQIGETKEASEKINSALRTDFANRARFFDRNPDLAEGMVDKDIIIVLRDGKIERLSAESQIRTTDPNPDTVIKAKGKLLTLTSEQLMKYGVADILVPPIKLPPITEAELAKGQWPASQMALFHQPFFDKIPNATIDSYRMDWKTRFFVFLASPIVSSILMLGLMAGFYWEMSSPGLGFPATIAFICLFLIALSSLSLEIANWLEVILLVSGLLIILAELFILPTFGILGIFGILLFLAGLFGMMLPNIGAVKFDFDTKTLNAAGEAFIHRLAWLCATLLAGAGLILLLSRFVTPKFMVWNKFVLDGHEQDTSRGYISGPAASTLPPIGSEGEAMSMLRPAGKIIINGSIFDAISSGNYIEQGTPIVVTQHDGSIIVVDKKG